MVFPIPPAKVFTVSNGDQSLKRKSGTGTIEITNGKIFLATGKERIELQPPIAPEIRNGSVVRYAQKERTIQLTLLQQTPETININAPSPLSTTEALTKTIPPVTIETPVKEGIHRFHSVEALRTFLQKDLPPDMLKAAEKNLIAEGSITIQTVAGDAGKTAVYLLSLSDLNYTLKALQTTFTSPPLASMPAGVFELLLEHRGSLQIAQLHTMDTKLQTLPFLFPQERSGSATAQNHAIAHWMHTAMDTPSLLTEIAHRGPFHSVEALLADLETMSTMPSLVKILSEIPTAEQYINNNSKIDVPSFLENVFAKTGYSLEHTLHTASERTDSAQPETTLKEVLLKFLTPGTGSPPPPQTTAFISGEHSPQSGTAVAETASSQPAVPQNARITEQLVLIKDAVEILLKNIPAQTSNTLTPHPEAVPSYEVRLPNKLTLHPELLPSKTVLQLTSMLNNIPLLIDETSIPADSPVNRLFSRFTDVLSELTAAAKQLSSASMPGDALSPTAAENITPQQLSTAKLLMKALHTFDILLHQLKETTHSQPVMNPDGTTVRSAVSGSEDTAPPRLSAATSNVTSFLQSKMLQSPLETLESLQLLARPVPDGENTRQIIALPVNINGHWTEINLRFVKNRKKKHGRQQQHFSVVLSVAPEATGAISVHIDYRKQQPMQIAFDFERNRTKKWFARHKSEILSALNAAGVTPGSFELRKIHLPSPVEKAALQRKQTTMIDMKV